jgi:hypothetical protein
LKIKKSLPYALTPDLQLISAEEAYHQKQNNVYFCPRCYQLSKKQVKVTLVRKSEPPCFRKRKESDHEVECRTSQVQKYIRFLAQKLQIPMIGDELQLTLSPLEDISRFPLADRFQLIAKKDNQRLLHFTQKVLQTHHLESLHKIFRHYRISQAGISHSLHHLLWQPTYTPPQEPIYLSIIVGTVREVMELKALINLYPAGDILQLHFPMLYYETKSLKILHGQKVICLGYIKKLTDPSLYKMDILSFAHQIAFITEKTIELKPLFKKDWLKKALFAPAQTYRQLSPNSFQKLYTKKADSLQKEKANIQQRLKLISDEIAYNFREIQKVKQDIAIFKSQLRNSSTNSASKRFLLKIQAFFSARIERENQIRFMLSFSQQKLNQLQKKVALLQKRKAEVFQLLQKVDETYQQTLQQLEKERQMKEKVIGPLYELPMPSQKSIIIQLNYHYSEKKPGFVSFQAAVFLVKKADGYYLPEQKREQHFTASDLFDAQDINTIVGKIWNFIHRQIEQFQSEEQGMNIYFQKRARLLNSID